MSALSIDKNTRISLHFALLLEDGAVVDSNFEADPASFNFGDGSLLAGFENKLIGLAAGDEASFEILPQDAFGQPNPNNVQRFKRSDFAADMELAEGLVISFADASQAELPGVVKSFDEQQVEIDFNHPLAGKTITFKVKIVDVSVIAEELH